MDTSSSSTASRSLWLMAGMATGAILLYYLSTSNNTPSSSNNNRRKKSKRSSSPSTSSSSNTTTVRQQPTSPTTTTPLAHSPTRTQRHQPLAFSSSSEEDEEIDITQREPREQNEYDNTSEYNDDENDLEISKRNDNNPHVDESQNLLTLLYNISEDQARKEGYVHRSITCNHCGSSPIRGFRFKCANCVDFDLCETCEAQDVHFKTHSFIKIRIPIPPLANPRSALMSVFYPGDEFTQCVLGWDRMKELQKKSHFDQVEIEALYEQFRSLSTAGDAEQDEESLGITKEVFEQCLGPLGLEKNLITERIFAFFDQDEDELISFEELVCGLSILCKGSLDERIKYAFKGYDLNNDGKISRSELTKMFKAYFHLSMELVRDVVKTMEEGMMENFDDEGSKPVSAAFSAPIPPSSPREDGDGDVVSPVKGSSGSGSVVASRAVSRTTNGTSPLAITVTTSSPKGKESIEGISTTSPNPTTQQSGSPSSPSSSSSATVTTTNRRARFPQAPLTLNTSTPNPTSTRGPLSATEIRSPRSPFPASPSRYQRDEHPIVGGSSDSSFASPRIRYRSSSRSPSRSPPRTFTKSRQPRPSLHPFDDSTNETDDDTTQTGSGSFPVMEAMSQDAIAEMVDKTFELANAPNADALTFEMFRKVVERDANLLAWFEALGSVF